MVFDPEVAVLFKANVVVMVGVHRREDSLKLLGANLPLDELGLHFVAVTALVAVLVHLTELRLEHREELTVFL